MPGRRADHTSLHVAGNGQWSAELANAFSVAGEDGIDGGIEILGFRALQILRLIAAAAPPSSVGGMEAQAPAQPAVGVDHGQQALELADGGAGPLPPELEHAANSFTGRMRQDGGHGTLVEAGQLMSVPLDVLANPFDLVDGGDHQ
jgi:hypothetical protein